MTHLRQLIQLSRLYNYPKVAQAPPFKDVLAGVAAVGGWAIGYEPDMRHDNFNLNTLAQSWRWILGVAAVLTLPTYGFTVPFRYAFIAHALAVLIYIGVLLFFGARDVIEGAIPIVITVVLFALLSHQWQHVKEKRERLQQERHQTPRAAP